MNVWWWIGQSGIVLELIGAGLGVYFAWVTRKAWSFPATTLLYEEVNDQYYRMRVEFRSQLKKQAIVFGLIAFGLALQFAGNYAK